MIILIPEDNLLRSHPKNKLVFIMFSNKKMKPVSSESVSISCGIEKKLQLCIDLGNLETVGYDIVAECINMLIGKGARPCYFSYYLAHNDFQSHVLEQIQQAIQDACIDASCQLQENNVIKNVPSLLSNECTLIGFGIGNTLSALDAPIEVGDIVVGLSTECINNVEALKLVMDATGLKWTDKAPWNDVHDSIAESVLLRTPIYTEVLPYVERDLIKRVCYMQDGSLSVLQELLPTDKTLTVYKGAWKMPSAYEFMIGIGTCRQEILETCNCGIGLVMIVDNSQFRTIAGVIPNCVRLGTIQQRQKQLIIT